MQLYFIIHGLSLDTGLNPRLTNGDAFAEGIVGVDAAIAWFDQLVTSGSKFSIELVDGGGIHILLSELYWREGLPDPTHLPSCHGYYTQWFPRSETGSNDFAQFHRHVTAYVRSHPQSASAQANTWLTGPYRLVPKA